MIYYSHHSTGDNPMTTNIHPIKHLTFSDLIQLQADHGLVLQRVRGDKFVFRHQPKALTGPGLARLSQTLRERAQ